ncbi:MAG: PAS domain S-box protein [Methanomicrobiaceae archaeon]|nr:PAS domain S-box protein [Methanomicrobiaceae archaeon]
MENKINADELREWTNKQTESPDRMWQMIYNSMAEPIFILSNEGEILYCNRATEEFLEMPSKDILGRHCYELVHKLSHFIEGCPFVKSMGSHKRESYQLFMDKWYMVKIDPLINDDGDVIGAIHFITDINEIVRLNTDKTNLAEIVENTCDAIVSIKTDGIVKYWNYGAEKLFGYSEDEITGKDIRILFTESKKEHYEEIMKKLLSGETFERFESALLLKNGDEAEISINVQPMYDERGIINGISFMAHDLSQERKAERELLSFVTESALRLKKPVEIIRNNTEDIKNLLHSDKISKEDAEILLNIQITNADKILENLKELNNAVVKKQTSIPDAYAEFLKK